MSYLSTALSRIAARRQLTQAEIGRHAGLARSHVSRIFSGYQRTVTDQDFVAILKAFHREPLDQAELVAARCMDDRVGPGAERVEISIKDHVPAQREKQTEFPDVELSHETERAFQWLRTQCPLNPDLEKHLVGFARMMGMQQPPAVPAR